MQTIIAALAERARAQPESIALIWQDAPINAARFDAMATAGAVGLLNAGVLPGNRVLLYLPNSRELTLAYYACFKAGATAVPVPNGSSAAEIRHITESCQPHIGLTCTALPTVSLHGLRWLTLDADWPPPAAAPVHLPAANPDHTAIIIYTSGTTGRARGVMHTHRALQNLLGAYRRLRGETMTVVVTTPIVHSHGFFTFIGTISTGGTVVLQADADAEKILDAIDRHSAHMAIASPKMAHALADVQARSPRRLATLSHINVSGDIVPVDLQQRFRKVFGPRMRRTYGSSEAGPMAAESAGAVTGNALGFPFPGADIRILDGHGRDVAAGEVGEIVAHTPWMASGYWDNFTETAAAFRDGWLHTGDLGFRDASMRLHFTGRKKEFIVSGGQNISPLQIEEVLRRHPAVEDVAAWGLPDIALGQSVAAWVVVKAPVTAEALRELARSQIAKHKCPEQIFFVTSLPKTATGKPLRRMLTAPQPFPAGVGG